MPYCCQCGGQVDGSARFCGKCGAAQAGAGAAAGAGSAASDFLGGISNRQAALLCYIPLIGWIAAIVVLASERFRRETQVRFHAFQGLYLFVAWLMVEWVISPALAVSGFGFPFHRLTTGLLQVVIFGAWVFMIVKVAHNEDYKLPIVGELAERSVSEQRS